MKNTLKPGSIVTAEWIAENTDGSSLPIGQNVWDYFHARPDGSHEYRGPDEDGCEPDFYSVELTPEPSIESDPEAMAAIELLKSRGLADQAADLLRDGVEISLSKLENVKP